MASPSGGNFLSRVLIGYGAGRFGQSETMISQDEQDKRRLVWIAGISLLVLLLFLLLMGILFGIGLLGKKEIITRKGR